MSSCDGTQCNYCFKCGMEGKAQRQPKQQPKQVPSTKQRLRSIKGDMKAQDFDSLRANLRELIKSQLDNEQLDYFVKLIQSVCLRLDSALRLVDSLVCVVKCLESSARRATDIYSAAEFQKYLTDIDRLTNKEEISRWITTIRNYILQAKIGEGGSQTAFKAELKRIKDSLEEITEQQNLAGRAQQQLSAQSSQKQLLVLDNQINQLTSLKKQQSTKADWKQEQKRTYPQQAGIKNQEPSPFNYKEPSPHKQANLAAISGSQELPVLRMVLSAQKALSARQVLQARQALSSQQVLSAQQALKASPPGQQQSLQSQTKVQKPKESNSVSPMQSRGADNFRLIKSILGVRNQSNLNFLKRNLWELCRIELSSVRELYSSQQNHNSGFHSFIDYKASVLVMVQLINGIVLGGYTKQPIEPACSSADAFLFSLSRKEAFPRLTGSATAYDPECLLFGREELRIKEKEMVLVSRFGEKDCCFDCKNKDVDYFLGEGPSKRALIFKYMIYQVL